MKFSSSYKSRPILHHLIGAAVILALPCMPVNAAHAEPSNSISRAASMEAGLLTALRSTASSGSFTEIRQFGVDNLAAVSQSGDQNTAQIEQFGSSNSAHVEQLGEYNKAHIIQHGNNNLADLIQDGSRNSAVISQNGDQSFSLEQIGSNMDVIVIQN